MHPTAPTVAALGAIIKNLEGTGLHPSPCRQIVAGRIGFACRRRKKQKMALSIPIIYYSFLNNKEKEEREIWRIIVSVVSCGVMKEAE